jgi:hypothetical protein
MINHERPLPIGPYLAFRQDKTRKRNPLYGEALECSCHSFRVQAASKVQEGTNSRYLQSDACLGKAYVSPDSGRTPARLRAFPIMPGTPFSNKCEA